ncbi:hypothetical protein D3C75_1141410 [compost metagenome]
MPLPPAKVFAAFAAVCAAVTLVLVVVRLLLSPVIEVPWLLIVPSAAVTRVVRLLTAEASALVLATVKALAAAAAASVATLSVTAAHAEPVQRFGVFAPPVMSIHRFCAS